MNQPPIKNPGNKPLITGMEGTTGHFIGLIKGAVNDRERSSKNPKDTISILQNKKTGRQEISGPGYLRN